MEPVSHSHATSRLRTLSTLVGVMVVSISPGNNDMHRNTSQESFKESAEERAVQRAGAKPKADRTRNHAVFMVGKCLTSKQKILIIRVAEINVGRIKN